MRLWLLFLLSGNLLWAGCSSGVADREREGSDFARGSGDEETSRVGTESQATSCAGSVGTESQATVHEISFNELLLDVEPGKPFDRAKLTARVQALDGATVRIKGYIHQGSLFKSTNISEFVFTRGTSSWPMYPDENIVVSLETPIEKNTVRPITLMGVLSVEPWHGEDGAAITAYRLRGIRSESRPPPELLAPEWTGDSEDGLRQKLINRGRGRGGC